MKPRASMGLALAAAAGAAIATRGMAETKQVPVVRIHHQVDVAAPPAAVWAYLTQGKNLVTWCPEWKAPSNTKVSIAKVGDVLDYSDEWGNNGRSIVTYLVKDKELRVAHEPNKGDYMCQAKLVLTPAAKGTTVHFWEQYTDESVAKDLEATAQKMDVEILGALTALKKGIERK
jgi:uncharacterized protein YndB with AHSA1/START domain